MSRLRTACVVTAFSVFCAIPAAAQNIRPISVAPVSAAAGAAAKPTPKKKPMESGLRARVAVTFGTTSYAAKDSLETVTGTSSQSAWGLSGEVTTWKGLYGGVAGVFGGDLEGERVFVYNDTVYKLGIPVAIRIRPVDVFLGWRQGIGPAHVFLGGGVTTISYEETSDFASGSDNVSDSKAGMLIHAGVDVPVWRWAMVGAEVRYRNVKAILGEDGVSAIHGDTAIGGISFAARLVIGK